MGLLDKVAGKLGGELGGGQAEALISRALSESGSGGLQGIVSKLQQGGLSEQVSSWLGNGSNLPVTPEQLRSALGEPWVQQFAGKLGLPVDSILQILSKVLPETVNKASQQGTLQPDASNADQAAPQGSPS